MVEWLLPLLRRRTRQLILLTPLLPAALVMAGYGVTKVVGAPPAPSLSVHITEPKPFSNDSTQTPETYAVFGQVIKVGGYTNLPASVALRTSDGRSYESIPNIRPCSDARGQTQCPFVFDGVSLHHGENRIHVVAQADAMTVRLTQDFDYVLFLQDRPPQLQPPTLDVLWPSPTGDSLVRVHGKGPPATQVELHVEGAKHVDPVTAWTNPITGEFDLAIQLPEPGSYDIWGLTLNSDKQTSERSSPSQGVRFDPEQPPPSTQSRSLVIETTATKVHMTFTSVLPHDTPLARELLQRNLTGDQLVTRLLGSIMVNQLWLLSPLRQDDLADWFRDTRPSVTVERDLLRLRAESNRELDSEPLLRGFDITMRAGGFLSVSSDSMILRAPDYVVESTKPEPTQRSEHQVTWKGPISASKGDQREVQASFSFNPLRAPSVLGRLGADGLWPAPGHWFAMLVTASTFAIPFALLVRITRCSGLTQGGKVNHERLRSLLRQLVTVCFLAVALDLITALAFQDIDQLVNSPSVSASWHWLLLLAGAGLAGVLLGHLMANRSRANVAWPGVLIGGAGRALAYAAAATLAILAVGSAGWFPSHAVGPLIWVLAFPFLAIILVRWWLFAVATFWNDDIHWLISIAGAAALVVLAAGLTLPVGSALYDSAPEGAAVNVAFGLVNAYAWLASVAAAVALIGFAAILRDSAVSQQPWKLRLWTAVVLFLDFLVPAGGQQLSLPFSFVIGLLVARYFMFVPSKRAEEMATISEEVSGSRAELIEKVLNWMQARALARSSENLTDKVASGEVAIDEALKRRQQFKAHLVKLESDLPRVQGVHPRNVVLAVPPGSSPWNEGLRSARTGLWLSVPLLIVNYFFFFRGSGVISSVSLPLAWSIDIVIGVVTWVTLAFFFGYYFEYLRGTSGITKALRLSLLITLTLAPMWIFNASNLWALLAAPVFASEYALFLSAIGAIRFDYKSLCTVLNDRPTPIAFVRLVGMGGLLTVATLGAAGIAGAVLTGAASEVIKVAMSQVLSARG